MGKKELKNKCNDLLLNNDLHLFNKCADCRLDYNNLVDNFYNIADKKLYLIIEDTGKVLLNIDKCISLDNSLDIYYYNEQEILKLPKKQSDYFFSVIKFNKYINSDK